MMHPFRSTASRQPRFVSIALIYFLFHSLGAPFLSQRVEAAALSSAPAVVAAASRKSTAHREHELLIRFRDAVPEEERNLLATARGLQREKRLHGASRIEKLKLTARQDPQTLAAELAAQPGIEWVEPNFLISRAEVTPDDPRFSEQWALRNHTDRPGADIAAPAAWEQTTGSTQTVIAVIDSGVDFTHPDLARNRWTNPAERANVRDDDHDGYADDLHGWDWVADNNQIKDEQGHGTAVAGIIAAEGNNGIGTTGVMWSASLMSLRVLDKTGAGDIADAVEAIDYAVGHGARVINLSWGLDAYSMALKDAIERASNKGVVVVCAAGNNGRNLDSAPYYPASYDLPNVIAVAATDSADNLASWSNWGATRIAIAAPGIDILTTHPGGEYRMVSGTSAAAPLVSGVAGLIKTVYPALSAADTRATILSGGREASGLNGKVTSGAVVNVYAALVAAGETGSGSTGGNGNNNGGGNGDGGANGGNGQAHGQAPIPGAPAHGSGGHGPDGGFNTTRPEPTKNAPPGLVNQDVARKQRAPEPKAPTFIQSALMPLCDADCGDSVPPGGSGPDPDFSTVRNLPPNETGQPGVDLGSRNFNWSLPLVTLPGRSGMDLGISLHYNSLLWTKEGSAIKYNADRGFPGPGFRLGMPTVQQRYYDTQAGVYAYNMITSSGGRISVRQVGTSNVYESQDGSYTQLSVNGDGTLLVRTSDGTQLTFHPSVNNEYRCTQIKDRNGNYISVVYNSLGRITTITDTLGRVVTFNYDANNYLTSITQNRGGAQFTWATFSYGEIAVQPSFPGLTVQGPNYTSIPVLQWVGLPDGTYYGFGYENPWGVANRIVRYAPSGQQLAYTFYNIPSTSTAHSDSPRFTERRDWARDWNGGAEAVTTYSNDPNGAWSQVTSPDGTVNKEFFATSGWQNGLTTSTEVWSGGVKKKWTSTAWTQDDTNLSYRKNPRPEETNIYDEAGNRRRTRFQYTSYSLPSIIYEYAANGTTLARQTNFAHDLSTVWLDRRIIGLMTAREVYDVSTGSYVLVSRTTQTYDSTAIYNPGAVARHDDTNYGAGFVVGRGNLTAVHRFDTTDPYNLAKAVADTTGYDTAGSIVSITDAGGHRTELSYADSFSDGVNTRNTFAYPTAVTDAHQVGQPSPLRTTAQYNFDMGVVTRAQDLKGAAQVMTYDGAGRIQRVTNEVNNAYTRYEYDPSWGHTRTYSTIKDLNSEAYTNTIADGAGRPWLYVVSHPGSTGGYRATQIAYDSMGRVFKRSNMTEITGGGTPTGDDAAGYQWTLQQYDWQGRPTLTTYPTGNTTEATYGGGCGCAGGDVTTVRDERGRRRKLYKDVFGRLVKVEELNWDQTVYATSTYSYNGRDQLTGINQAGQTRSLEYDGHGRLSARVTPEQGRTTYNYTADDLMQTVTDARGATRTFVYDSRHLVTNINYGSPGNVAVTANVSFGYDAAGNRTSMTDGLGSKTYNYDTLSRLTWEERTFAGLGTYRLTYDYNVGGGLKSVTNPWNVQVSYAHDTDGRVTGVTGLNYGGVSTYAQNLKYRAFDGLKEMTYGNGKSLATVFDSRLRLTKWDVSGVLGYNYSYDRFSENSGRVTYAQNLYDNRLDRSFDYDHLGRLQFSHSGVEARMHAFNQPNDGGAYGPYAQHYYYDVWGNITQRAGWGGANPSYTATYTNNRRDGLAYDPAGNLVNDGGQAFSYDATGQQTYASGTALSQAYDGDRLRVKKVENGATTYYLRSSVMGNQVVAELDGSGGWVRGYVYLGAQLLALQYGNAAHWVHQDPVAKSQRITEANGTISTGIELDPWGGETAANWNLNPGLQTHKFTTYERDQNQSDEAQMRRYNRWWTRFDQPDPFDGSYNLTNPQSLNRYSYTGNDPVNFTDPSGLFEQAPDEVYRVDTWTHREMSWVYWRYLFWSPDIGGGGGTDIGGGGGGGGGAPAGPTAPASQNTNCDPVDFAGLSAGKQQQLSQMGVSADQWNGLGANARLGFFNVTGAISSAGLSLNGWQVDWAAGGIMQDRVYFAAGQGAGNLLHSVSNSNGFAPDIGRGGEHGAYTSSYREVDFRSSLQMSFTGDGGRLDADIDIFNPNLRGGNVLGTVLHGFEVAGNKISRFLGRNGKTNPNRVAQRSNWECKPK